MGEINRVTVRIYGQEYIIAGEMPREHIMRVADYVDGKMNEIAEGMPTGSTTSLAVLSAVNAADEYFRREQENKNLRETNEQQKQDIAHYVELWEEAKKTLLQYKEECKAGLAHRDQLQLLFNERTVELNAISAKYKTLQGTHDGLQEQYDGLQEQYEGLRKKNEDLTGMLQSNEENNRMTNTSIVKELEAKCRDVESSFFDLQMENIQLKSELDRYRKSME